MNNINKGIFLAILGFTTIFMASCDSNGKKINTKHLSSFFVKKIEKIDVTVYKEYAANIEGVQNVEIRPKVSGFIEKIYIDEGSTVRKGQLLFKLNAEALNQQVNAASAGVDVASSQVDLARVECDKIKPLVAQNIISAIELQTSNSRLNAAKAQLNAAKANLLNLKDNLSYAFITSPVNGIVGSIPYKVGSLVGRNEAKALTTVSNITNVYAYFSMNEKQLLEFIRNVDGNSMDQKIKQMPELELYLADGSLYEEKGKIETINGMINPRTGSVRYRAKFSNINKLLRNGNSGKLKFPVNYSNVILLSQKASFELQGKRFVYVLGSDNIVKSKEIIVSETIDGNIIISSGISIGETVVSEGIIKLRSGMEISPIYSKKANDVNTNLLSSK